MPLIFDLWAIQKWIKTLMQNMASYKHNLTTDSPMNPDFIQLDGLN